MKKVSELLEGENITYAVAHTTTMFIVFSHDYGSIEGYVFTTLGGAPPKNGVNLYLTPKILNQFQEELVRNGATITSATIGGVLFITGDKGQNIPSA